MSQARAARQSGLDRGAHDLHERLEDAVLLGFGDAAARVADFGSQRAHFAGGVWRKRHFYGNRPMGGELDRIADEVVKDLANTLRIDHKKRKLSGAVGLERDVVFRRTLTEHRGQLAYHFVEVGLHRDDLHAFGFDF